MATFHPEPDDHGRPVQIHSPHTPDGEKTFTPGSPTPNHINGIPLTKESDPHSGLNLNKIGHIPFTPHSHKQTAAGMIIVEPDNRVWLTSPTNGFGGYQNTFPKGRHEAGSPSLEHTAAKEAWEETGLKAQPTHHLGDYERTTTKTRYFVGRRISGSPAHMGWESQAVHLVHVNDLHNYLHSDSDRAILSDLRNHLYTEQKNPNSSTHSVISKIKSIFPK